MKHSPEQQAEHAIVWYYKNSGCRISKFKALRIKMWYFFETGTWLKQQMRTASVKPV